MPGRLEVDKMVQLHDEYLALRSQQYRGNLPSIDPLIMKKLSLDLGSNPLLIKNFPGSVFGSKKGSLQGDYYRDLNLTEGKSERSDDLKHIFKGKNKSVISKVPLPKMLVVEDFNGSAGGGWESATPGKQIMSPLNGQIDKVNLTMESIVY